MIRMLGLGAGLDSGLGGRRRGLSEFGVTPLTHNKPVSAIRGPSHTSIFRNTLLIADLKKPPYVFFTDMPISQPVHDHERLQQWVPETKTVLSF